MLKKFKKEGRGWSYSAALKETGGDLAYTGPAKVLIDAYQTLADETFTRETGVLVKLLSPAGQVPLHVHADDSMAPRKTEGEPPDDRER